MAKKELETTDLEPVSKSDIQEFVGYGGVLRGFEDLDSDDFTMPRMRLCQSTSRTGVPGKFFSVLTNEVFDELNVTVLSVKKSRGMWPKTYQQGDKHLCRSYDGKVKSEGVGTSNACAQCQYSKWSNEGPPACQELFTFLCIDDNDFVFILNFKSTAIKYIKKYISALRNSYKPPFSVVTRISVNREENKKGVFFVPQFEIAREHDLQSMKKYNSLIDQFSAAIPKDVDDADVDSGDGAVPFYESGTEQVSYMGDDHLIK